MAADPGSTSFRRSDDRQEEGLVPHIICFRMVAKDVDRRKLDHHVFGILYPPVLRPELRRYKKLCIKVLLVRHCQRIPTWEPEMRTGNGVKKQYRVDEYWDPLIILSCNRWVATAARHIVMTESFSTVLICDKDCFDRQLL